MYSYYLLQNVKSSTKLHKFIIHHYKFIKRLKINVLEFVKYLVRLI